MKLILDRPLVVFDLETTGLNPLEDRIIEICCLKLMPDGERITRTRRVNPERPINPEASAITGITDEMVKNEPPFRKIAKSLADFIAGCDIAGYNIMRFDLTVLTEEFRRAQIPFSLDGRHLIDAQRIFHKKESRTLEAALRFYCGKTLENAHAAENDVLATLDVIEGQLDRYPDIAPDTASIAAFCKDERFVDLAGRIQWKGPDAALAFGKKQGTTLRELAASDASYLEWIIRGEFPEDTKKICRDALKGVFPVRPATIAP